MKNNVTVIFFFLIFHSTCFSQTNDKEYNILFYNLENLFDVSDNPETEDDEFTPPGSRHWNNKRLKNKLVNISRVILNATEWEPPEIITVCEVENRYVLDRLLKATPLAKYPYRIIHKESPDPRGIDVALMYNEQFFYPLEYKHIPLPISHEKSFKTREILYVKGIMNDADTLHIFVNHWPSRYSGLLETNDSRKNAALTLRGYIDNLMNKHWHPKIIITGDFNDQPKDKSIVVHLNAKVPKEPYIKNELYNLSYFWMKEDIQTLKHQSQWNVFDQFLVSGSLLNSKRGLYVKSESATIIKLPFLFETDTRYGGVKLNRTYSGYKYNGGFSDHLPVRLKLNFNE